jgi:DNA-binding beta-propeller fold protein YncE
MASSMFVGNYLPTLLNSDVALLAWLVNSHQTGYPGDAGAFWPIARTTELVDGHHLRACLQFGPLHSPAAVECAAPDGRLVFLSTSGGLNNGWIGQALQVSFDGDVAPSALALPGPVLPAPLSSPPAGEAVSLLAPHALAVGPTGTLYVVDPERDEVLADDGPGAFRVVAGDGRRGFGGDGGPALDAQLRLDDDSGIAVSENGTLYVADSGNDRVRAVSPNGTIETVLGNGAAPSAQAAGRLGFSPTAAHSFTLGAPQGLALAPNGDLVVAASAVVRLSPDGMVSWVAGGPAEQA